jgi:hypothetical protein
MLSAAAEKVGAAAPVWGGWYAPVEYGTEYPVDAWTGTVALVAAGGP